jgi:hypothetical protein
MGFIVRHGSNNYGGAGGLPAGISQNEQFRAQRESEKLRSRQLDLQEQALAQRAQEFVASLGQNERRMLLSEEDQEADRKQQAEQFAANLDLRERQMLLNQDEAEAGRQHGFDMIDYKGDRAREDYDWEYQQQRNAQLKEEEMLTLQKQYWDNLTPRQKQTIEQINDQIAVISQDQVNGLIGSEAANNLKEQLIAKANGIVPSPLYTPTEPTPQEQFDSSVVTDQAGNEWYVDPNGNVHNLNEQAGKDSIKQQEVEYNRIKAVREDWIKIHDKINSMTTSSTDENGMPVEGPKYTPEEAARITDQIMQRFGGGQQAAPVPPLVSDEAFSQIRNTGKTMWDAITNPPQFPDVKTNENDPLGLGL